MKGLLDPEGVIAGAVDGGAGGERGHAFPREWTVIVNRVEGSLVRFLAGGVDLIEPGGGEKKKSWRAWPPAFVVPFSVDL